MRRPEAGHERQIFKEMSTDAMSDAAEAERDSCITKHDTCITTHAFGGSPMDTSRHNRSVDDVALDRGNFSFGAPLGIPLFVAWTSIFLLIIMVMQYRQYFDNMGIAALGLVVLGSVTLFFSIVVHEYAHGLTSNYFGNQCKAIVINGMGGMAYCGRNTSWDSIRVSAAGPLSAALFLIPTGAALGAAKKLHGLWATVYINEPHAFGWIYARDTWYWQWMIFCLNAIPWLPGNDASHIVQTSLKMCGVSPTQKVFRISWTVNAVLTLGLLVVWIGVLGQGFSINLLWIVGLFGYSGYQEYQLASQLASQPEAFDPRYQPPAPRSSASGPRTTIRNGVAVVV